MRVLVACEYSGRVRDAFAALGHVAWSCDLLDSDAPGRHYQCNVLEVIGKGWDLMVAHPPCTHLAASGARWWSGKRQEQSESIEFVRALMAAPIARIAIENPIGALSKAIRKPDQIIQPWQFGHGETKATCLWLKGLPLLTPTNVVDGAGSLASITCRRAQTVGSSAASRTKESQTPLPANGGTSNERAIQSSRMGGAGKRQTSSGTG